MSETEQGVGERRSSEGSAKRTLSGDLAGGLSAAVIALPLALGFGVISFAPLNDPAGGALAGLYGAIFTGIFAAIFGGTPSQVTGPTGPMTIVTTSIVVHVMQYDTTHGHAGEMVHVLVLVFMTGMLGGIFQIAFGVLRLGTLIKFIPYPVVAGFMNGIAVIIFLGQVKPFLGLPADATLDVLDVRWPVAAAAATTVVVIVATTKLLPKLPAGLMGLALGTGSFFLYAWFFDPALLVFEDNAFIVGRIPRALPTPHYVLDIFGVIAGLDLDVLAVIVPPALALAVLGAIDSLLTSLVADVATESRHDSNRELVGQGIGNMVASAFGGLSGAGATVRTLVNVENGGRSRISGVVHGVALLLVLVVLGPAAGWIPMSVLAGILVVTAVNMVDNWSLSLLRKPTARRDVAIIFLVTIITVAVDLMVAVGIGMGVSVLLFLKDLTDAHVARAKFRCRHQRSKRVRSDEEELALEEHGDEILVYELEGSLFFGVTDKLATDVEDELRAAPVRTLVLDLKRVQRIDITGAELLKRIVDRARGAGLQVKLTALTNPREARREMVAYLQELEVLKTVGEEHLHPTLDDALEAAEDALLRRHLDEPSLPEGTIGLVRHCVLFEALTDDEWEIVYENLEPREYDRGEVLYHRGEPGDRLCVLEEGHVSAFVMLTEGDPPYRIASFGPGGHFGDMSFLEAAPRTGTLKADEGTKLWTLSRDAFYGIEQQHPATAFKILHGLAHRLSERLRVVSEELVERERV